MIEPFLLMFKEPASKKIFENPVYDEELDYSTILRNGKIKPFVEVSNFCGTTTEKRDIGGGTDQDPSMSLNGTSTFTKEHGESTDSDDSYLSGETDQDLKRSLNGTATVTEARGESTDSDDSYLDFLDYFNAR